MLRHIRSAHCNCVFQSRGVPSDHACWLTRRSRPGHPRLAISSSFAVSSPEPVGAGKLQRWVGRTSAVATAFLRTWRFGWRWMHAVRCPALLPALSGATAMAEGCWLAGKGYRKPRFVRASRKAVASSACLSSSALPPRRNQWSSSFTSDQVGLGDTGSSVLGETRAIGLSGTSTACSHSFGTSATTDQSRCTRLVASSWRDSAASLSGMAGSASPKRIRGNSTNGETPAKTKCNVYDPARIA